MKPSIEKRQFSDPLDDTVLGQVLKGTCICLTGFKTDRKKEMMKSVQKLGGRYVWNPKFLVLNLKLVVI